MAATVSSISLLEWWKSLGRTWPGLRTGSTISSTLLGVSSDVGAELRVDEQRDAMDRVLAHGIVAGAPDEPSRTFRAGPGAAVGVDAAFGGMPYEFRATAESRVVAIRIDASVLMDVMEDHPDFAMRVLRFYAREHLRLETQRTPLETVVPAGLRENRG